MAPDDIENTADTDQGLAIEKRRLELLSAELDLLRRELEH